MKQQFKIREGSNLQELREEEAELQLQELLEKFTLNKLLSSPVILPNSIFFYGSESYQFQPPLQQKQLISLLSEINEINMEAHNSKFQVSSPLKISKHILDKHSMIDHEQEEQIYKSVARFSLKMSNQKELIIKEQVNEQNLSEEGMQDIANEQIMIKRVNNDSIMRVLPKKQNYEKIFAQGKNRITGKCSLCD